MSLQLIPLRWMIKECLLAKTKIQFNMEYLRVSLNFDFKGFVEEMKTRNMVFADLGAAGQNLKDTYAVMTIISYLEKMETTPSEVNTLVQGIHETIDRVFDPLASGVWWILEFFPFLTTRQDSQGNWIHKRM